MRLPKQGVPDSGPYEFHLRELPNRTKNSMYITCLKQCKKELNMTKEGDIGLVDREELLRKRLEIRLE